MGNWKDFEDECANYVSESLMGYARVQHIGMSNSAAPDIVVESKLGNSFSIEAKNCPAQSGQFVLLPNIKTKTFDYSKGNSTPLNEYAQQIIDYMNSHFDTFRNAGKAGEDIVFPGCESVFANWIIQMYQNKGTQYIITNGFRMVNIEDFGKAFNIIGRYRIKRSGSSDVGITRWRYVMAEIERLGYGTFNSTKGNKLYIKSDRPVDNTRFIIYDTEFMISQRGDKYEVRRLSNTYNTNVIFSIDINPLYNGFFSCSSLKGQL